MSRPLRLPADGARLRLLAGAVVAPRPGRCIECGTCAFHCPMGIDVRSFVRGGEPVTDRRCLACGSCVARCPRGVLEFRLPDRDRSAA